MMYLLIQLLLKHPLMRIFRVFRNSRGFALQLQAQFGVKLFGSGQATEWPATSNNYSSPHLGEKGIRKIVIPAQAVNHPSIWHKATLGMDPRLREDDRNCVIYKHNP